MDYLKDYLAIFIALIVIGLIGLLIGLNAGTDRYRELENAAIARNYAKLIVDENRLVQFQWIEPQTKESMNGDTDAPVIY